LIGTALLPYVWMLFGALSIATMGAFAHGLASSCQWQVVAVARTAIALVLTTSWALAAGAQLVVLQPRTLWMRSAAGSVSLVCTFFALSRLPVADVFTLTNVFPVWVALLSWPILREAPTRQVWIAIAVGLAGVALVQQPHFSHDDPGTAAPAIAALVASVSTAIAMLGLHRLHAIDPRAIVAHFSGVAMVVVLASLFVVPNHPIATSRFDSFSIPMLVGVGIFATIGQLFLTKAFAAGPPAKVSVVALAQVVFAAVLDVLIWDHKFPAITLVGMFLVMAPTVWLLASQPVVAGGDA
jgi:drug/metabolite transporter (DMT)-like permease